MRKMKKTAAMLLAVGTAVSLAACGSDAEEERSQWLYVPEFPQLPDQENISWYDVKMAGDSIYYPATDWDEASGVSSTALCSYSLLDGTSAEVPLELPEDSYLNNWAMGEDGSIYTIINSGSYNEAAGTYEDSYQLLKLDAQGKQVYLKDITDLQQGEYTYFSDVAVDSQGRVCSMGDSQMFLFDSEGNPAGSIATDTFVDGYMNTYFRAADGNVYGALTTYADSSSTTTLYQVNFDTKKFEEKYTGLPSSATNNQIAQDAEGNFLFNDGSGLLVYDPDSGSSETLLNWLDSDINGGNVNGFSVLSDGRIAVVYEDWSGAGDSGIALLTKTEAEQVARKQEILIGVIYPSSDLQAAAVAFNKSNDTYRVSVRQYMTGDDYGESAWTDAMTRLNNDITSKNCPDLILLDGVDVEQLSAKEVFADITPYLENSTVIQKDDVLESVINAYTYNGRLVGLPTSFSMSTMIGNSEDLGTEPGWTLEEMIEYADAHPDKDLFHDATKDSVLRDCLSYNMDQYVDWEQGSCHFDSDEFKSLLQFVERFPDDSGEYVEGAPSEPTRIQNGEVLMVASAGIYELDSLEIYNEMFQGNMVCIGFPNSDGSSGCIMEGMGALAITEKSDVKEGAWAFMESYLTQDSVFGWGFPILQSELDEMVEEETQVYVTDENGENVLDEEGNPIRIDEQSWSSTGYEDGWSFRFRTPTMEEVDMILALMEGAKPASDGNQQIMNIITEETEAFFQGQKTVDEVAEIIQNRANVYVSENS